MTQMAIYLGENLAEELMELSMSAAALAREQDVPTNRVSSIERSACYQCDASVCRDSLESWLT